MSKELLAATERELADWPGVTMTQEPDGGKHSRVILHYKGQSRLVIVAKTPSDVRALPNHLALVRRELRALGAEKARVIVGKPKEERPFKPHVPATHKPLEVLEQIVTQPKKTEDKFRAIFTAINDLRYGEMMQFAAILADGAVATNLKRRDIHGWAHMLQFVGPSERGEDA